MIATRYDPFTKETEQTELKLHEEIMYIKRGGNIYILKEEVNIEEIDKNDQYGIWKVNGKHYDGFFTNENYFKTTKAKKQTDLFNWNK